MAGSSDYQILLRATIDAQNVRQQLDSITKNYVLRLNVQIDEKDLKGVQTGIASVQKQITSGGKGLSLVDLKKENATLAALQKRILEIQKSASSVAKVSIVSSPGGGIESAQIRYADEAKRAVTETMGWVKGLEQVNGELKEAVNFETTIVKYSDDIAARTKQQTQDEVKRNKELQQAVLYADKFLERSKTLSGVSVGKGIDIAKGLKDAANVGDLTKVQSLNRELQVIDSGLRQSGASAWSFNEQLKVAFERTMQWASATTIVFGTIQQFREGIAYISELNKEMTNIQVLQVEGAKSREEIAGLSMEFNNLAKNMGATTLEVARGSTEWLLIRSL